MLSYIERLRVEISALRQRKINFGLSEYEDIQLDELEEELREKEHYQYLSDNDIEY